MTNAQAERAINQLYESDTLRSELRDEEASLLLSWGEMRLSELADHDLPDDQFDDLFTKFRALLVAINVCVGKRKTSPSQHLPMMASISSAAEAAGYALHPDDQKAFLKHQFTLSNQDAISELLGLLKPFEITQPPAQNTTEAVAESVLPPPVTAIEASAEAVQPSQPEVLPEPPAVATEVSAESIQPPQPEDLPEPPQLPPQEG